MRPKTPLRAYYRALITAWGPQDWWPARTRFEVIVGAFFTQNTAWTNVERALANLRRARLLSVEGIRRTPLRRLETLIRPAGYFRQKAHRLKNFVRHLDSRYRGSLALMFARPTAELRAELLALNGIGPETADSILLYAGGHPSFVVDAYSRRILERHGLITPRWRYDEIRELFERALVREPAPQPLAAARNSKPGTRNSSGRSPQYVVRRASAGAQVYNEFHALLVRAAKHHCLKKRAECSGCPLEPFLPR
ncbi:MAG: endonuclease III domain-containing protein [Terriglobales bacterium]